MTGLVVGRILDRLAIAPRTCYKQRYFQHDTFPDVAHRGKTRPTHPKYRLIDDVTRSRANHAVDAGNTYFPNDIDASMDMARLRNIHGASELRMRSVDFANDYKMAGLKNRGGVVYLPR